MAAWLAIAGSSVTGQTVRNEVIGEDEFRLQRLAALCRSRLPVRSGEWMRVTFFTAEPSPYFLQQSSAESFATWLKAWRSAARVPWRVAEMTAVGGDAVLRIRAGRSSTRVVIAGRDPLQVEVRGRRYEILHISGSSRATLYVRGPQPLACGDLYRVLRPRFGTPITIKLRTDPWFVRDPGFPPFYWFQSSLPPTREAIESAPQATCGG
jgi:hypothetical protein